MAVAKEMEATFGRSSTKGGLNHIQDLGRRSRVAMAL
jgi:hypothetical protein